MSILGNRVQRLEDPKFLTVGGTYVADLDLPGSVHAAFVRSSVAHAVIESVDTSGAAELPGVLGVFTHDDLGLAQLPTIMDMTPAAMAPMVLAHGTVRYVGEPLAVVVAESAELAVDAAELVVVEYDSLPAVVDPVAARRDETLLFPEAGTNAWPSPSTSAGTRRCSTPARSSSSATWSTSGWRPARSRCAPPPPSSTPRGASSSTPRPRTLTESVTPWPRPWASTTADVHVMSPDVGGGFGAKGSIYPEELAVGWCARRLGRPVRWTETRSESMLGTGPWPGPGPVRDHRRHPRRRGHRLPPRGRPGLRRLPRHRRRPALHDQDHVDRHLRHPEGGFARVGGDEHHPDCRLPGRRPPRGHGRHRAGHGPVRRARSAWTRPRSGGAT